MGGGGVQFHQVDNVNVDMQRGRGSFHQVDNVNVDMQRGRSSFHQVDNCHVLLGKRVGGRGGFHSQKCALCACSFS